MQKPSIKQVLVNAFGGKCQICGYDKCLAALSFHHRDPSQKEFEISKFRKKDLENYVLLRELEKTILLCENCHRELHSGRLQKELEEIPEINLIDFTL